MGLRRRKSSRNHAFNLQRAGAFTDAQLYCWAFSNDIVFDLPLGANLSDGLPHTIVVTLQADGQTANIYYDGEPGSTEVFAAPVDTQDGTLMLGQTTGPTAFAYFDQWMHFAVWSGYAVTADEARELHERIVEAPRLLGEGKTVMTYWPTSPINDAMNEINKLVATEGPGAQFYEGSGRQIVFRDRHAQSVDARSRNVQATYGGSGNAGIVSDPRYYDPLASIVNECTVTVTSREVQSLQEVWSLGQNVVVAAGQTVRIRAQAPGGDPFKGAVAPNTGDGDYTVVQGTVDSITLDKDSGTDVQISITATASDVLIISGLRLRAQPVTIASLTQMRNQIDASSSISQNGLRTYPLEIITDIDPFIAQDFCDAVVGWWQFGRPNAQIEVAGGDTDTTIESLLERDIGDRIRVILSGIGVDDEWWVLQRTDTVNQGLLQRTVFGCEATFSAKYFVLDVSVLDGPDVIGF